MKIDRAFEKSGLELTDKNLILYFHGTFINNENGAHARVLGAIDWALRTFAKVTVYSHIEHPTCPWKAADIARFHRLYPDVELVLDHRPPALVQLTSVKNALLSFAPGLLRQCLKWRIKGATPGYDALKARPNTTWLVNYIDGLTQLNGIDPKTCIVDTHDLIFLRFAKHESRSLADFRVLLKFRKEVFLLGETAGLIGIAPFDAQMFREFFPNLPVFHLASYGYRLVTPAAGPYDYDMLFVASDHAFNIAGIIEFLRDNGDWLQNKRIAFVGNICAVDEVRAACAAFPNIDLLGYADSLDAISARAKTWISPVGGTGLKIKAIDALAQGRPLLASALTLQGLPAGYESCAFRLDQATAEQLLADETRLQFAGQAAHAYIRMLEASGELFAVAQALLQI